MVQPPCPSLHQAKLTLFPQSFSAKQATHEQNISHNHKTTRRPRVVLRSAGTYLATDPYLFLVWWHCGYPASDNSCAKGWASLSRSTGTTPEKLLAATPEKLAAALKPGGMVPELRALRLKEIAMRVQDHFCCDLRGALLGSPDKARKELKKFPNIADPGADRILLFAHIVPIAAVPSNCPHVLVRIHLGRERENYGVNYREAQDAIESQIPATFDARTRAYLLLKHHGQLTCKRTNPKCEECPVNTKCAFFSGKNRGRPPASKQLTPAKP